MRFMEQAYPRATHAVISVGVFVLLTLNGCVHEKAAPPSRATLDNLLTAYNGERNAHSRYLAFAKKADSEGYGKAASLFKAAARAEQVHYGRHAEEIKKLGGTPNAKIEAPAVKTTKENIEAALKGETYESEVMYPGFIAQVKKEANASALDAFEDAMKAEAVHAAWYRKALGDLDAWKGPDKQFMVCPTCGNVVDVLPGPACPICGTDTKKFIALR